jgi:hypothetical protein
MAFPRWSVGTINLGLVFVPYVTMPGGKGWWRLIRGIETLERQKWHSHAGAWERSKG